MNPEKIQPIKKFVKTLDKQGWHSIVGIGVEETKRLVRLHNRPNETSLLEKYGFLTNCINKIILNLLHKALSME